MKILESNWSELMAKRGERLKEIADSYKKSIDFVLEMDKKHCRLKKIDEQEQKQRLNEYRNAQEMSWLYSKVVRGICT